MFWNKNKKEAEELMRELSDSFSVVKSDTIITPEVQSEYIAYHDKIDRKLIARSMSSEKAKNFRIRIRRRASKKEYFFF